MKLYKLKDPYFIACLLLLLFNDLVLKYHFGNWLTGKLSDFCGLFVFPLFWSALFPAHSKRIHIFTAMFFIAWKSPLSEPLLHLFDTFELSLDRVVDYSDLMALPMICLSYYRFGQKNVPLIPIPTTLISVTSLLAFCATSQPRMPRLDFVNLDQHYVFPIPLKDLAKRMNRDLRYHSKKMMRYETRYHYDSACSCYLDKYSPDTLAKFLDTTNIGTHDTIPVVSFLARMKIVGYGDSSALILDEIHTWAPASTDTVKYKKNMLKTFNRFIVKRLREE